MPLYEANSNSSYRLVRPSDAENYDVIQAAQRKLNAKTFLRMLKTVDDAIEQSVDIANEHNRLAFTKTGILVGNSSIVPHKHLVHFWDNIAFAYPMPNDYSGKLLSDELQKKLAGGIVRWRTSLRPETWIGYKYPSGKFNPATKEEIFVSHYYVSNTFVYNPPPKKRGFTVSDLSQKWGRA